MRGLVAAVATVADLLRRSTPCTPRVCSGCGSVVTRLTPAQSAQAGSKILPTCRRRGCTGVLCLMHDAIDRLITDIKNGAPGWTPGTPPTAASLEGATAMDSIPRQAQELRPDDIITRHPDHPNRKVWYRVDGWPKRVSHAQMLVNYTCRPPRLDGDSAGVLVLDIDQECQVIPAHTQGGAA